MARRRGRRGKGRKSKSRATRRARIVLSKVNYLPAESKMQDIIFGVFGGTTSDAESIDPDISVSYLDITGGIVKGVDDDDRIGNVIFVKSVAWNYSWDYSTVYGTSAGTNGLPRYPGIHVFLVALKCEDVAAWFAALTNGKDIKPDAFDTMYKKLRTSCTRIIRHWKLGGRNKFMVTAGSQNNMQGRIKHVFNTPIRCTYKDVGASQIRSSNQLAMIIYRVNDGDTPAIRSWALHTNLGSAYHNMRRLIFMG